MMLSYLPYYIVFISKYILENESIDLNRGLIYTAYEKAKRAYCFQNTRFFLLLKRDPID